MNTMNITNRVALIEGCKLRRIDRKAAKGLVIDLGDYSDADADILDDMSTRAFSRLMGQAWDIANGGAQ